MLSVNSTADFPLVFILLFFSITAITALICFHSPGVQEKSDKFSVVAMCSLYSCTCVKLLKNIEFKILPISACFKASYEKSSLYFKIPCNLYPDVFMFTCKVGLAMKTYRCDFVFIFPLKRNTI